MDAGLSSKLFIGGLSAQTTTEGLGEHFSKYGLLIDSVVMWKQGRPRGFGFVTYECASCATAALAEPQWLGDRFVDVKRAVPGEQPTVVDRAPNPTNKIFVGGLPQDATTEDLRTSFAKFGPIADAVVMVDRHTQRSRGFGFVRFASGLQGAQAAEAVLAQAANHCLGGKWIEVKRATPATAQESSPTSLAASSPSSACSPSHRQQQQWPGLVATPTARETYQRTPHSLLLEFQGAAGEGCGMYSPQHWNALAGGYFGQSPWEMDAFSPLRHCPADLSGFHHAMFEPSFHLGGEVAAQVGTVLPATSAFPTPTKSSRSFGVEEENKPAVANRAVTPPPGQRAKKASMPPGLFSPMKVEFPTRAFDQVSSGLGPLLMLGSDAKAA